MHVRILAGMLDRSAGSHVYHYELATRLAKRGHRVSVVCFQSVPEIAACAELTVIPARDFSKTRIFWRLSAFRRYVSCYRGLRAAKLDRPDVCIGGEHLFLREHCRKFPGVPWIYLPHSLTVTEEINLYRLPHVMKGVTLGIYRNIQRWALQHASCTLRFTEAACQVLSSAYRGVNSSPFIVNPIGIDLPELAGRAPDVHGRAVELLIVGQLIYRKGVDIALVALKQLRGLQWHLNIVGGGPERVRLEEFVRSAGIQGQVSFVGQVSDPAPWYRSADLLLFPSRSESLGLVVLEAMSYAVPCLAFRADGTRFSNVNEDHVRSGWNGLLAADEREFVACLSDVLKEPDRLAVLGENARATVMRKYSWGRHLERYEETFEKLARGDF